VAKAVRGQAAFEKLKSLVSNQVSLDKVRVAISSKKVPKSTIIRMIQNVQSEGLKANVLSKLHALSLGQVFRFFKEVWDELPEEFTQAYSDGYYGYIREVYGYGTGMCDMYADIWEGWFSGKYKFQVPSYVDVLKLPVVKMRLAASYLMRDEMTPNRWKALSNRQLSRSELSGQLRDGLKTKLRGPAPKILNDETSSRARSSLSWETGDISLYVKGNRRHVGHLDTSSKDPLVVEEIRELAKARGMKIVR